MSSIDKEKLIAQAENLCRQRSAQLTPRRLEVLRLLAQQAGAISAYDLLDLLRVSKPRAKPPTVYRALDFLLQQGIIHRVESDNSYILCHHLEEPAHTSALFICDQCRLVVERTTSDIGDALRQLAKKFGFSVNHSVIEAHGLCSLCRAADACN